MVSPTTTAASRFQEAFEDVITVVLTVGLRGSRNSMLATGKRRAIGRTVRLLPLALAEDVEPPILPPCFRSPRQRCHADPGRAGCRRQDAKTPNSGATSPSPLPRRSSVSRPASPASGHSSQASGAAPSRNETWQRFVSPDQSRDIAYRVAVSRKARNRSSPPSEPRSPIRLPARSSTSSPVNADSAETSFRPPSRRDSRSSCRQASRAGRDRLRRPTDPVRTLEAI